MIRALSSWFYGCLLHPLKCPFFCHPTSNQQQRKKTHTHVNLDHMSELCERSHNFLSTYRKIDGAEVISRNERNLECIITFQTHSILQRFMLRFEVLKLDCNDHLYIFDGAHASNHKADISCRNTKQNVGTLFTRTNYVRIMNGIIHREGYKII